ncbi:hypothetical protein NA56DRAFT_341933 [Hyaloscypha hepaticicola]|uniref:Uncharacterized protein n=1 Tax=Hyaloscypha hepaticicola TaxID=2082293 RepID=A0A2J6QJ83_9HELO|nr:hypothetical protein NA56DRAFT_341933 [Hyaloscypha hepaticicola]
MPPSKSSLSYVARGSVTGSRHENFSGSNNDITCNHSKHKTSNKTCLHVSLNMAKLTSKTSAKQEDWSATRIKTFLDDPIDSQILHRHSSNTTSIHSHTTRIAVYLVDFEAAMKNG